MQNGISTDEYSKHFESRPFEVKKLDREDESIKACNFTTSFIHYFFFD